MWCISCQQERAVAPTRMCKWCLSFELHDNEQEGEREDMLVIALEPHPYDIHVEIMRLAYPFDPTGASSARH